LPRARVSYDLHGGCAAHDAQIQQACVLLNDRVHCDWNDFFPHCAVIFCLRGLIHEIKLVHVLFLIFYFIVMTKKKSFCAVT